MAWFTRSKKSTRKKEHIWTVCPSCNAHIFRDEWNKNGMICPKCDFHDKISFQERLDLLVDKDSFKEINGDINMSDPLNFTDGTESYSAKAEATKAKSGLNESIVTGTARIKGVPVVIGVMDFRFFGGSLGSGTGERIARAAAQALKQRTPLILVSASGGARMQEGIVSLMQMAKTCSAIARLNEQNIPYISILTHPTTGGVSASYAMVGDINIAEPGVLIGFAGRRVIEQTIKQKLPNDFQTAEYTLKHGFIDAIVKRNEMRDFIYKVLKYWNR